MRIEFRILGAADLRAVEDGQTKAINLPPKVRALLAYLALERPSRLHARDSLTALFWPELDQEHARSNLRRALYVLRRQLGPEVLVTRGQEEVGLDRDRFWCDAVAFDELAGQDPEGALALYRGELLPAAHLNDSAEFERWLETERTRLRDRAMVALGDVAGHAESEGRLAEAVRWRRKALAIDAYDEEALRRLMVLRARLGDRAGALQAYDAFERRVREDLDLEPDEATRELAEAVRRGEIAAERLADVLPGLVGITAEASAEPKTPVAALESAAFPIAGAPTDSSRKRVSRSAGAAILVVVLLVGLGSLYFATHDRQGRLAPGKRPVEEADTGIAVMPFEVSGVETEEWREGMVILLSTGLDGMGSLRAIDSRTVLAQWDRRAPGGSAADRETALEVARATDARYAVLGSAVRVGPQLRLVADVFSVDDGARLGTAQAEGTPDDVLALIDELVRGVLGVILDEGEGEIPPVHLAALTTNSLPALKAFLEGEALYRRGRIEESIAAYDRAVEADSTFALAWNRLAGASSWLTTGQGRVAESSARALRHADRLPPRARLFVELESAGAVRMTFESMDLAREATRRYPDDAHAWHLLGEIYLHFRKALLPVDEAEAALLRAVQLDPTFAPYRYHPTELAFSNPPDSALASERVRELSALDPEGLWARAGRLAFDLAFGDPVRHSTVLDSIRTLDLELVDHVPQFLQHPRFWEFEEEVTRIAYEKGNGSPVFLFWGNILKRGRIAEALQYIDMAGGSSDFPTRHLWEAHGLGIPIPEAVLEDRLAIQPADTTASLATAGKGFYALDRGRREDYARCVAILRRAAARARVERDSTVVRDATALLQALEGYERWKAGDPSGALPRLLEAFRNMGGVYPYPWTFWIGQIYLDLGQPAEAVPYFQARRVWHAARDPLADYHAGVALEQAGQLEAARRAYASLVEHWRDPDPEIRPLVEHARQAMIRLGGARRQ